MATAPAARLAALEAAHAQRRDDLAAVVDIVAKLVDDAIGQPPPGQLQRRFIAAKRQLAAPDKLER
jgi:hypothetical protein